MRADAGTGGAPVKVNNTNDAIIPLDNADSWIVGSDRMDNEAGVFAKYDRAWFNKIKGAFRAGQATGTEWDDVNVGHRSAAFGSDTKASGLSSFACGTSTTASGTSSHAEGTLTVASGLRAHAEGQSTTASADNAHAEGRDTTASNWQSHAEGQGTTASGLNSHAEGNLSAASGQGSHAEGYNTKAQSDFAHAEGHNTTASGTVSHAEGNGTTASGPNSHAEGEGSRATGVSAHAENQYTEASGNYSHAEGQGSVASRRSQYAKSAGGISAAGDAQIGNMVASASTTDAVAKVLTSAALPLVLTGATANVLTLPASRAFQLKISTVARRTDVQGEMAGFTWEGLVGRDATGNARIIGTPVTNKWSDTAAAAYAVAVSIDAATADNYVAVTVTGEAAKTIRWVAKLEWVEVGG